MTAPQLALTFGRDTAQAFEQFHADNPRVYETLVRLAREWVARTGRNRLGMKSLFERARWDLAIETDDPEYTLNNNWTAWYSRLLMIENLDLAGLFELRPSAADEWVQTYRPKAVAS